MVEDVLVNVAKEHHIVIALRLTKENTARGMPKNVSLILHLRPGPFLGNFLKSYPPRDSIIMNKRPRNKLMFYTRVINHNSSIGFIPDKC